MTMRTTGSIARRSLLGYCMIAVFEIAMGVGCGSSNGLSPSQCGTGTHLEDGKCIVDTTCGPGTTMVGSLCQANMDAGVVCGLGTLLVAGQCISAAADAGSSIVADAGPSIGCDVGTHLSGTQCLPDPSDAGSTVVCGPGTYLSAGACLANPSDAGSTVVCGLGTHLSGGTCVPDPSDAGGMVVCGFGTHLSGNQCLADASDAGTTLACGPGTQAVSGQCLPVPDGGAEQFIVRVGVTTIGADGFSTIPVTILGTAADGTPSKATIVLDTSRAGAGTISPNTLTLTPTGATAYFTPCSAAASSWCPGTVRIILALASAPNVVVANSQEITLVAPTGVGSDSPCLAGGNVIFFNGDSGDYIYSGVQTITQGQWSANVSTSEVHISVDPSDESQGMWWDLYFETSKIPAPITTQVYEGAERWPFESTGHPGLDVSGDGRGCNTVTGRFQVESLVTNNGALTSFTATFEHHCEGGTPALRGCVHYEK